MKTRVSIPADFCVQLAERLSRLSSTFIAPRPIGVHVDVAGEIWYMHVSEDVIYWFGLLHNDGFDSTVTSEVHLDLPATRGGQNAIFTLDARDIEATLLVCDKVRSGAESVPLIGEILISPSVPRAPVDS